MRGTLLAPAVHRLRGYDVVRIALGLLLLTAAGLKTHQLATEPVLGTGLLESRWLLMATVEFELLLGLWLLANVQPRPAWAAAVVCFGLFTCISLRKAISGDGSCGCFGRVSVNPWYTAALDASIVFSLLRWRPKGHGSHGSLLVGFMKPLRRQSLSLPAIWLCFAAAAAIAMASYTPSTLSSDGDVLGNGNIVILEPESWIGGTFPLLKDIDLGEQLASGEWSVLLYHYDCPACKRVLTTLERMARHGTSPFPGRVALAEVPPYTLPAGRAAANGWWVHGRLNDLREWLVETPVVIEMRDGEVLRVWDRKELAVMETKGVCDGKPGSVLAMDRSP